MVYVCMCVTKHVTSRMFVHLTHDTTYFTGRKGQICLKLSIAELECIQHCMAVRSWPYRYSAENLRMLIIIIIPRGGSDHFVSRSEKTLLTFCELLFALTVMPLKKVCPQCEAVPPMRLKVCKSCQHVI